MDNKKIPHTNLEKNIKDNLLLERRKTASNCMNLECKNEQLKILIDRLHNLASKRESFLLQPNDSKQLSKEVDPLLFKKSTISEELEIARENSEKLERAITRLKNKISTIDEELAI